MNTVVTSEDILKTSRKLILQQGWPAINIRSAAAACGASLFTIILILKQRWQAPRQKAFEAKFSAARRIGRVPSVYGRYSSDISQ